MSYLLNLSNQFLTILYFSISPPQIDTIAYPKQRLQFLDQLDFRLVSLSIIAGVALLLCSVILLWTCGFFKRFVPKSDPTTSTTTTASSTDQHSHEDAHNRPSEVVDIAKSTVRN